MHNHSTLDAMHKSSELCIKKDLITLQQWQTTLEENNQELDCMLHIQQQIIKTASFKYELQQVRRENTLCLASLCNYEQQLVKVLDQYEYVYDKAAAKHFEKKRNEFLTTKRLFFKLKKQFYNILSPYSLR